MHCAGRCSDVTSQLNIFRWKNGKIATFSVSLVSETVCPAAR